LYCNRVIQHSIILYKVCISIQLIQLFQFLIVRFFQILTRRSKFFLTIVGRVETIVGSERATVTFSNGTQVTIKEALLYPNSTHTLIRFRNIRKGGLHVCTHEDNKEEFLLITKSSGYGHEVLEKKSFHSVWIVLHMHQTHITCFIQGYFPEYWYIQDLAFRPRSS
jgi:hypothetical protein